MDQRLFLLYTRLKYTSKRRKKAKIKSRDPGYLCNFLFLFSSGAKHLLHKIHPRQDSRFKIQVEFLRNSFDTFNDTDFPSQLTFSLAPTNVLAKERHSINETKKSLVKNSFRLNCVGLQQRCNFYRIDKVSVCFWKVITTKLLPKHEKQENLH